MRSSPARIYTHSFTPIDHTLRRAKIRHAKVPLNYSSVRECALEKLQDARFVRPLFTPHSSASGFQCTIAAGLPDYISSEGFLIPLDNNISIASLSLSLSLHISLRSDYVDWHNSEKRSDECSVQFAERVFDLEFFYNRASVRNVTFVVTSRREGDRGTYRCLTSELLDGGANDSKGVKFRSPVSSQVAILGGNSRQSVQLCGTLPRLETFRNGDRITIHRGLFLFRPSISPDPPPPPPRHLGGDGNPFR